jgi:hypothetical protein
MKMPKAGHVSDHLNEFNIATNQLIYVKMNFDDEVRDLLILCSLLERWNGLVMVVLIKVGCHLCQPLKKAL